MLQDISTISPCLRRSATRPCNHSQRRFMHRMGTDVPGKAKLDGGLQRQSVEMCDALKVVVGEAPAAHMSVKFEWVYEGRVGHLLSNDKQAVVKQTGGRKTG